MRLERLIELAHCGVDDLGEEAEELFKLKAALYQNGLKVGPQLENDGVSTWVGIDAEVTV